MILFFITMMEFSSCVKTKPEGINEEDITDMLHHRILSCYVDMMYDRTRETVVVLNGEDCISIELNVLLKHMLHNGSGYNVFSVGSRGFHIFTFPGTCLQGYMIQKENRIIAVPLLLNAAEPAILAWLCVFRNWTYPGADGTAHPYVGTILDIELNDVLSTSLVNGLKNPAMKTPAIILNGIMSSDFRSNILYRWWKPRHFATLDPDSASYLIIQHRKQTHTPPKKVRYIAVYCCILKFLH